MPDWRMRRQWLHGVDGLTRSAAAAVVALAVIAICITVDLRRKVLVSTCGRSATAPRVTHVEFAGVHHHRYHLYRMRPRALDTPTADTVIVFVPGHNAHYGSAVNLLAASVNSHRSILYFTVDLQGDPSALDANVATDAAVFVHECVSALHRQYPGVPISVIGHSMGGVIARAALARSPPIPAASLLITLNSPLRMHPFAPDARFQRLYDVSAPDNVAVVSVVSGYLDTTVHSSLGIADLALTIFTGSIPTVWTDLGHDAVLRCATLGVKLIDAATTTTMTTATNTSERLASIRSILLGPDRQSSRHCGALLPMNVAPVPSGALCSTRVRHLSLAYGARPTEIQRTATAVLTSPATSNWHRYFLEGFLPIVSTLRVAGPPSTIFVRTSETFTGEGRWFRRASGAFPIAFHPSGANGVIVTLFLDPKATYVVSLQVDLLGTLVNALRYAGWASLFPACAVLVMYRGANVLQHPVVYALGVPCVSWAISTGAACLFGSAMPPFGLLLVHIVFWIASAILVVLLFLYTRFQSSTVKRRSLALLTPGNRRRLIASLVPILVGLTLCVSPWATVALVWIVFTIVSPSTAVVPGLYGLVVLLKTPSVIAAILWMHKSRSLVWFNPGGHGHGTLLSPDVFMVVPLLAHMLIAIGTDVDGYTFPARIRGVCLAGALVSAAIQFRIFLLAYVITALSYCFLGDLAYQQWQRAVQIRLRKRRSLLPDVGDQS